MFHTFVAQGSVGSDDSPVPAKKRRARTRACQSCRKRKTYCDGEIPCGTCKWYRKSSLCFFVKETCQSNEVASERRSEEKGTKEVPDSTEILKKLFPGDSLQGLANLSREQLLDRLQDAPDLHSLSAELDKDSQEDERSLEQLQDFSVSRIAATSRPPSPSATNRVTDDINALALSPQRARSYLGVSSVVAVLRIILILDPESKAFANSSTGQGPRPPPSLGSSEEAKVNRQFSPILEAGREPTIWDEVPAINAYFTYIHPQIPLLNERDFRECYMNKTRDDTRWKFLLYSVLAMGSVAATTAEEKVHLAFYEKARQHMNHELFSSAHLEIVQALIIMGGMYLHYIQQPNLASCLIGATFRMATILGLHRDYCEPRSGLVSGDFSQAAELRRRIWWSLCCLDACNSNFLGRPTLGRLGPGHSVKKPESSTNDNPAITALLQDSIDYCVISTRLDDHLAEHAVLGHKTRQDLDQAFLHWLNRPSLSTLKPPHDTPAGVAVVTNVMRWRCHSARLFIYRPILLWYAMRREPMERISASKREAISTCRQIAAQLIQDISSSWFTPSPCVMAGWPATWLIYQSSMVPILSLFCDNDRPDVVATCRQQVELVISTLSALESWSCTARRSLEVVQRLYNASQAYQERMQGQQLSGHDSAIGGDRQPDEATGTINQSPTDLPLATTEETPTTTFSGSNGEDFLLNGVFDDISWMDDQQQSLHGVGNDLAFLDFYDI